ncbi:MAG: hypothetical protein WCD16_00930 [Paracoccaceae bacterium]
MPIRRILLCLALPLLLGACAESVYAPEEAVQKAAYRADGPPSITLFTMVNNRSNEGGHSAIMVNASQRVIFDPAGTWWHHTVPERNDVLFGITPLMLKFYIDYHARETYRVVEQTKVVSPELAEQALKIIEGYGAVPKAMCGRSTSDVLNQLPGFQSVPRTFFPGRIMRAFGEIPGVTTKVIYDDDSDNNKLLLTSQQSDSMASAAQPSR